MKYKVGDKTLLGEIESAIQDDVDCPYFITTESDVVWLTESEIDTIIIKPKRNIDHLAELWEMDSGAAYKFWKDNSRMNSVCYEDVAFMLAPYTEPSKPPQLTPEEIKALKLARDCGFNWITKVCSKEAWLSDINVEDDPLSASAKWIPSLAVLNGAKWLTEEPMSINELLKDEV